ncbi:Bone morphogenetic protein 2-B [Chelonia mydas]|uniref:Bone morphogenetic protein 2-B n=1 Tax=Chelonia mydas TaxID=8469 RepID=M7BEC2_CHEMY|nr:Bone morphogenetic protein 2-B [Chelonia mydas]
MKLLKRDGLKNEGLENTEYLGNADKAVPRKGACRVQKDKEEKQLEEQKLISPITEAEEDLVDMAASQGWRCLAFVLLLLCDPARLSRVSVRTQRKGIFAEAMRRLQEVFDIEALPHDVLPHRKPPQFMVDLFNKVADSNGITKAPGLLEGNVVRSLEDRDYFDQSYFYFNISSVGRNEQMLKAELRVFKLNKNHVPQKSFWQHFLKVSKWVGHSSTNHGFLITTTHLSKTKMESNFVKFAKSQHNMRDSRNAFLVLFTNNDRQKSSSFLPSSTDDTSSHLPHQNEVFANIRVNKSRRIRDTSSFSHKDKIVPCQLNDLFVDFHKIGWAGWIISPRGYKAYYCKGACLFPLGESLRATNHATVQSIVHTLKLTKDVSTPCCVPDKLSSISIMYFDDNENVVLKNYKDMVATSCGCH